MERTDKGDVELSTGAEFEVFLNFKGLDIGLNFADCLYHSMDVAGIRVFRDNEDFKNGEAIKDRLMHVIKSCIICMPIFSRNYVSSARCLHELAYMVDCSENRGGKAMIWPIFFDVDPQDVKLTTGLYHDALQKHKQHFSRDVVQKWKEALREVARVKGWALKDRAQGELIRLIVAKALIQLNTRNKNLPNHLVGIQDSVEDVVRLLDQDSPDVRYLVIHGMGGIGKTTLAKVVFDQISSHFQGCSFLLGVREASMGGKILQLQKQLLSEILNVKPVEIFDSEAAINLIKTRLHDKKVLIVLDDVDRWDQLSKFALKHHWFGQWSRIIITTRDINFLPIEEENRENNVRQHFEELKIYQMRELHHHHALQLFSKHAFGMDFPPQDFNDISGDIIHKAGGLPFALEVMGSSLYGKSKQLWKQMLKKLNLVPNQDVLCKLKISFDMLEYAQREIFLDIACYFMGEEMTHPHYMWKALDFYPKIEIFVLTRMSLIKIVDGRLWMHDLLRDLGREIVRQENLKEPEKCSRLWYSKIALDVVQNRKVNFTESYCLLDEGNINSKFRVHSWICSFVCVAHRRKLSLVNLSEMKGTKNITALKLTGLSTKHDFTSEEFSWLPNLRLLELDGGNLIGDYKNLLLSLRWLSWCHCPSNLQAVNLSLWNLVVLKLSDSDIPNNWNGWGPCLANRDLKVIHLMRCHLATPPDFLTCLNLKILVFDQLRPKSLQIGSSVRRIRKIECLERLEYRNGKHSMEKMKDEARQQAADVETSDRNYAIAAVQNLVGIDDRVKHIADLLEMEVNDEVRIIGIHGTNGIGKTTLVKAVYDRMSSCFDSCSFLAEVDETIQNPRGIQCLQTKLISDILERDCEDPSIDKRIEFLLDIFRKMKVLIVVDDVEEESHLHAIVGDQLHWFGPGSRIIVTSENKEILREYDPEKAHTYMVSELDDGQAFELFCKHAFRMQSSRPDYDELTNLIVSATVKLPLAVEVIGSFLHGKSIQEWEKMEKSMKLFTMSTQKSTVGLEETFDICYKELNQQQKDIFLDIACFISGVDARIASYMWPNFYLISSDCILMPLTKIGENNELQMHRLLRSLGKRIVNEPRKFYVQDMVPRAISREKGMENVEAPRFDFTAGYFQSMPDITFLKLDNARVSGNFAGAFASLRWLCWQRCPLEFDAFNFVLRELVILDLSWSKVTEDWGGWSIIKMEKLKVLNLTGCSDLLITPNFSDYEDLEILILEQCSGLVKLDPSIGHLKRLVSLNLKFCSQLNGLPVELGCISALKELFIDGTSVREIPISIGNLKQLEILSGFKCFPLTHLPTSISYLTALSELSLDGAKITELPMSLGELLNLRRLSLRDCRYMEELPDSIGKMGSLEELDISATSISGLPDSIRNLESLRVLRMESSFIRAFPGEIGNLTKLEELHASWCRSLKGAIPSDIKGLHHLRSLTLGHSSISSLPPEISTIPGLHTLDLIQCNEIEELPKLPPSLICLCVSSKRMKAIPLLEDLKELEELCLSDGDLKARRPPSKLPMPESNVKRMIDKQSFSISFPKLRKLQLSLSQVIKLKFGPTDIPPLKRLKTLTLPGLSRKEVSELPKRLSVFKLYHSAIEEIEGLEGLEALKILDISNCKIQNLNGIGQITSLRSLILSDCDDLSLPDLSNLKSLKVLEIRRCKMIRQIEGLEQLTSLEKLNISECPAEKSVQVQNALKHVMVHSPVM